MRGDVPFERWVRRQLEMSLLTIEPARQALNVKRESRPGPATTPPPDVELPPSASIVDPGTCPLTPQQLVGRSNGALSLAKATELVERGGWEAYVS